MDDNEDDAGAMTMVCTFIFGGTENKTSGKQKIPLQFEQS